MVYSISSYLVNLATKFFHHGLEIESHIYVYDVTKDHIAMHTIASNVFIL